jgi:hypothetical protein
VCVLLREQPGGAGGAKFVFLAIFKGFSEARSVIRTPTGRKTPDLVQYSSYCQHPDTDGSKMAQNHPDTNLRILGISHLTFIGLIRGYRRPVGSGLLSASDQQIWLLGSSAAFGWVTVTDIVTFQPSTVADLLL